MTTAGESPENTTHQVFISYASENINSTTSDRQVADKICSALESQGIRCWLAHRDILPGEDWLNAIIDAVEASKVIVLVFSANTEQSDWVKDEVKMALGKKIKIIPIRIQDVSPRESLRILNVRCQWLHAHTPPLEKHFQRLVKAVSTHLEKVSKKTIENKKKEQPEADRAKTVVKDLIPDTGKIKETGDMPEDVKKVSSKADKVEKNKKGHWEAYYQNGIVMVYIPPGEFIMGQTEEEKKWLINIVGEKDYNSYYINEAPLHHVYLDGYWLGKYEVTFDQYDQYCEETKNKKPGDERWGRGKRPVINISWHDAEAYCQWLSQKTGLNFKLPTEARWEKAARSSDSRKYPWGSHEPNKDLANIDGNIGKTTPVDSYPDAASPYGLLDMAGNVWEWCSDWYSSDYYKKSPPKNPPGPDSGPARVIRGGGWLSIARLLRCTSRDLSAPSFCDYDLGFRLCQDI